MAIFEIETTGGKFQVEAVDQASALASLRRMQGGQNVAPAPSSRIEPRLTGNQRNAVSSMAMPNLNPPSAGGNGYQPPPASRVDMAAPPIQIDGRWHPAGTTREMIAGMPEGMIYNPANGSYNDVNTEAQMRDRGRLDAAIGGGMQGVSLGAGDEIIGGISSAIEGPEMGDLRRETARATLRDDRSDNPGTVLMSEIAGGLLLPGAAIKKGAGWLANLGRSAIVGSGVGGATAFNTGEGDGLSRLSRMPVGMALGAVGGAVAVPLAAALGKVGSSIGQFVRNRQLFSNGALTQQGQNLLQQVGIDPAQASAEFQQFFAREASRTADPADARAVAEMAEFGIPSVRANVTGDVNDFAALTRVQRTGQGPAANAVRNAIDEQHLATRRATERIATDMSGGNPVGQADAAVSVMQGLRGARDAAQGAARSAYDALEAAGAGVKGAVVQRLGTQIGARLQAAGQRFSDQLTPNAQSAISGLDAIFQSAKSGAVPFMDLERARQALVRLRSNAYRGTLGQDQQAMDEVIGAFDERVAEVMTSAMTEGDASTLDLARNARDLWSQYRQTFMGRDAGSKFIQQMIDADASPDDAVRWLFSAGRLGTGQFNSMIARQVRNVLGGDSEQWNSIRQAAFRQLVMKPEGTPQPGPQAMRTAISQFINGEATRDLSQVLFTADERALMGRFTGALQRMIPPPGAVNHSGTAYEGARMARQVFKALAAAVGYGAGGPTGALVATGAANQATGAIQNAAARAMLRPTVATNPISSAPVAAFQPPMNALADFTTGQFPFLQGQESRQ